MSSQVPGISSSSFQSELPSVGVDVPVSIPEDNSSESFTRTRTSGYLHPKKRYREIYQAESETLKEIQSVITSAKYTKADAERAQNEKKFLIAKIKGFQDKETESERKIEEQAREIQRLKSLLLPAPQETLYKTAEPQAIESNHAEDTLKPELDSVKAELKSKICVAYSLRQQLLEEEKNNRRLKREVGELEETVQELEQTVQEKNDKIEDLENALEIPDPEIEKNKKRIKLLEGALQEFVTLGNKTFKTS